MNEKLIKVCTSHNVSFRFIFYILTTFWIAFSFGKVAITLSLRVLNGAVF